jgi:hypothetical protein
VPPVAAGGTDQALEQAAHLFGQCLADDAKIRLYFDGPQSPAVSDGYYPIPTDSSLARP